MDHTYAQPAGQNSTGPRASVIFHTNRLETVSSPTSNNSLIPRRSSWTSGLSTAPNALGDVFLTYKDSAADIYFYNLNGIVYVDYFLGSMAHSITYYLNQYINRWNGLKFNLWLECKFKKPHQSNLLSEPNETLLANFKTKMLILLPDGNSNEILLEQFEMIRAELEDFQKKPSGWSLDSVEGILLRISKYKPLKGSRHIPLPSKISNTLSVINVLNQDDYCFKYAILSGYTSLLRSNTNRPQTYQNIPHNLDFSCIQFPVSPRDILVFEKRNKASVNLYALDKNSDVYPYRISPFLKKVPQHFNLLYLKDGENSHYCYIRNLSRLVHHQLNNHHSRYEICERCFQVYKCDDPDLAKAKLLAHDEFCGKFDPCKYEFPNESFIKFKNIQHLATVPIVIYGDIECLLKPLTHTLNPNSEQEGQSWTLNRDVHKPTCAGLYVKSYCPDLYESRLKTFRGSDCLERFMEELRTICFEVESLYKMKIPIEWTPEEWVKHDQSVECEFCQKEFDGSTVVKVADHDHLTGVGGLKSVWLKVPVAVAPGQSAALECNYDLEGEPLYTVKWYKGRQEFFRYVPKEHPHTRVFPLPGVSVDINASGPRMVVLRDVQMELAGRYRCEVSSDAPNFHTAVVSAHMHVVHMLEGDPVVRLEKSRYSVGDVLRGNCTSPPSNPPANVTWLINGIKINASYLSRTPVPASKVVSQAGLEFEVNTFTQGKMKVTCVADVYGVYATQSEIVLDEEKPRLALVRGSGSSTPLQSAFVILTTAWLAVLCSR